MPRWLFILAISASLAAALALRAPYLADRPMHGDEAVHTIKCDTLWRTHTYEYDPHEFHGPTLYYFTLPTLELGHFHTLGDTTEATFRATTLAFGIGLILLLPFLAAGLGRGAAAIAALLTSISPAMAFYSDYYIQEMLLVFFTFGAIVSAYRFIRTGSRSACLLSGLCVGLMIATKETWIIAGGCAAVALLGVAVWKRKTESQTGRDGFVRDTGAVDPGAASPPAPQVAAMSVRRLVISMTGAALVALLVWVLLFSAFLTHPEDLVHAARAVGEYLSRATTGGNEIHRHPWNYYLSLLLYSHPAPGPTWSEALIVGLAGVGIAAAFAGRGTGDSDVWLLRFLSVYTLLLTAAYALIPYKTPWCLLGFFHGMILMAGVGACTLLRASPGRILKTVVALLLAAGAAQLTMQALVTNGKLSADRRNPYVYAHPGRDVVRLGERLDTLAGFSKEGHSMTIEVAVPDPWPIPWYLRRFDRDHVGYWETPDTLPPQLNAPIILTCGDMSGPAEKKINGSYHVEYFGLRPNEIVAVHVRTDLWDAYLKSRVNIRRTPA